MGQEPESPAIALYGREGWVSSLSSSARRVAAAVLGGLACGVIIGGIGGRLAMFVLRLTSDASLHGLETDDGFRIGRFSGDTVFLLLFTAALGVGGGLFYLVVRSWFPRGRRALFMGVFGGVVGGAIFVRPGGIDFTRISPLPLAIALFVALPAAYGATLSVLVERWYREDSILQRSSLGLLGLIPLVFVSLLGVFGLLIVVVLVMTWSTGRAIPSSTALWHSAPAVWIGRALLAALTSVALTDLVRKTAEIL
jgi:hypothetical protein